MGKEKKEIWMEKLIELLNEYHHFNSDLIYYWWDEECEKFYFHIELPEEQKKKLWDALINDGIDEQRVSNEWVCSKKFWFIKWLVENDKIDRDKVKENWIKHNGRIDVDGLYRYSVYERVLMLLSISDTPIDDLISYLK